MTEKTNSSKNWKIYWIYLILLVPLAYLIFPIKNKQLEKYHIIGKTIRANKEVQVKINEATLYEINENARVRGTADANANRDKASSIRAETQYLLNWIDSLENELIYKTGGVDTNRGNSYIGAGNSVEDIMVGTWGMKNGKGLELKRRLDKWVLFAKQNSRDGEFPIFPYQKTPSLALNGNEDELYKQDPENKTKDFAELNFGKSVPLVAAIALLEKKAYEIAYYEGLILAAFNPVNSCGSWIDNITATYQSISQTIFAGSNYNASIFLTSSRNDIKSTVIFNGDTTSIEEDSSFTIKFKASGENYDENGIIKKYWTAKVAIPDHQGSYCYKELKGTYFVYKPKVVVSGNAVTALYEQCAYTLSIKVPSLGENYKPIFSCNAPTKRGIVNTELVVVPRSKEDVKLKIYTKDVLIDSTTFKVTPVPLPNFQIYANSSAINPKVGITSKTKKLSLKVIPDEGFASLFPSEAKYSIGKIQASIYHGSKLIKSFNVSNPEIPIPKSKADRIVIEVLKLYRTNSLGKKIAVNLKSKRVLSVFIVD